jgi:toxin ParE1/3/4
VRVEIVWSPLARKRLPEIRAYVAEDKPDTAARLAMRIVALAEVLKEHPYLGRAGSEPGVRELVVGGTPYLIFYRAPSEVGHDSDDLARGTIQTAATEVALTPRHSG